MPHRSSQYPLMKAEFVQGDDSVTITAVAEKYGRKKSAVTRMANIEGWRDERERYRAEREGRVNELIIDAQVQKIAGLTTKMIDAADTALDKLISGMQTGEIKVYPADVVKLMTAVREATAPKTAAAPGEGPEGNGGIHISAGSASELAGMVERIARQRLAEGAAPAAPRLVTEGSGR